MAISLEADFRSVQSAEAPEPAERQAANRGHGEDFASSLERIRRADADHDAVEEKSSDALPALMSLPFPPADTELAAAPDEVVAAAGSVAAPVVEVSADFEIVIDREIVREDAKGQAQDAAPETSARAEAQLAASAQPSTAPEATAMRGATQAREVFAATDAESQAVPDQTPKVNSAEDQIAQAAETNRSPTSGKFSATPVAESAAIADAAAVTVAASVPAEVNRPALIQDSHAVRTQAEPDAFSLGQPLSDPVAYSEANLPDAVVASLTGAADKVALTDAAGQITPSSSTITLAAAAPSAPAPVAAAPPASPAAPALSILTASPAQIVDIVSRSADDGQSDRVVVQLDPPELGRVSIDFKFDANGLQHVTITSETPEAMRQLRQMHFELVQSLERHGIGSQNMTFQHQQQGAQQSEPANLLARAGALVDPSIAAAATLIAADHTPGTRTLPGGRLDIRL